MDWPSRSPDLNPMENIWGILVRGIYKNGRQFSSTAELEQAIAEAWEYLHVNTLKSLIESMTTTVFEVIRKNGGSIMY